VGAAQSQLNGAVVRRCRRRRLARGSRHRSGRRGREDSL